MAVRVDSKEAIAKGETSLGIELGSTRIKAVLINHQFETIASGSYEWENRLENGFWTYNLDDVITGLQTGQACPKPVSRLCRGLVHFPFRRRSC